MLGGLGKIDRERITRIIRATKGTVSVQEAAEILEVLPVDASKMLSRWTKMGWFSRVRRGLYIPVPLESLTPDVPPEDPWIIAERLYRPCYIGGWTAAEYWDLTDQIFNTIVVLTTQRPRNRKPTIKGLSFWVRTVSDQAMFGLKPTWRVNVKVFISDRERTLLDMLNDPRLAGGLRPMADVLTNYLKSNEVDLDLLLEYTEKLGNSSVYKRLGFLLEQLIPEAQRAIKTCKNRMSKGNSKLDPSSESKRLVRRWRLWIPEAWVRE